MASRMQTETMLTYQMNHRYRGIAMVFCYKHFSKEQGLKPRLETNMDYSHIGSMLKQGGFEVIQVADKTKEETFKKIDVTLQNKKAKLEDSDCFVAVFMSYGADGVVFAKDSHMLFDELVAKFNGLHCRALLGKPKLFIVQASPPSYMEKRDADGEAFDMPEPITHTIPAEADCLVAWNPLPGILNPNASTAKGSLFIQTFCNHLNVYGKDTSVPTIIRKTIKKVCHELERDYPSMLKCYDHKVPYMINLLTKTFVLSPK